MDRSRRIGIFFVLILLGLAAVYLAGNNLVPLWDRDEPRYALCSQYMLHSGDWVVPHIGWGEDPSVWRTAKPVLIYWVQAASMAINGANTFAARLPSAVAMLIVVAMVGWCVSRFVGRKRGLWTMLVLGGSAMPIVAAKMCVTDAVLLVWVTAAQLCLYAIYRGNRSWLTFLIFWISLGLGGLTKGPVVIGHVGMTMLILVLLDLWQKWPALAGGFLSRTGMVLRWWGRLRPIPGLILLAAVVAPWLILMHLRAPGFLAQSLGHDVVNRISTGLEGHSGPPGYYLATIFGTFFPWSLLLPLALVVGFKTRRLSSVRFALAAVIGPWLMMELISTKLVHYVLPIFPPLAYLTAEAIVRCLAGRYDDLRNRLSRFGAGIWAIATVAMASLTTYAWLQFPDTPVERGLCITVLGTIYAGLVLVFFLRRQPRAALISLGIGFPVWVAVLFTVYLPSANYLRLSVRVADELNKLGATTPGQVITTGYDEQSLVFHSGAVVQVRGQEYLAVTPPQDWPQWIVLTQQIYGKLPLDRRNHLQVLSHYRGLNIAKGTVVDLIIAERRKEIEVRK